MSEDFTYNDLEQILEIKDRLIHTLLVGGGGALSDKEKIKMQYLLNKAKIKLKVEV